MVVETIDRKTEIGYRNTQEYAGLVIPPSYSSKDMAETVELHRRCAKEHHVERGYYAKHTSKGKQLLIDTKIGNYRYRAGSIGAFEEGEIGVFIQEQTWNYVHQGTLGKKFPTGDVEAEKSLLGMFIDGFNGDDGIISVELNGGDVYKPIAGARVVYGKSTDTLRETLSNGNSTLPTFWALDIGHFNSSFDIDTFDISETRVAGITRYWAQKGDVMEMMGHDRNMVAADVIAMMPHILVSEREIGDVPELAVFDIHNHKTAEFVHDHFGACLVAGGDDVKPTREVLQTVLKYHYGGEEYGGHKGEISIGVFDLEDFFRKSNEHLDRRCINLFRDSKMR